MKSVFGFICLFVVILFVILTFIEYGLTAVLGPPKVFKWNKYYGRSGNYEVNIEESGYGDHLNRIVKLKPTDGSHEITGHDRKGDGEWDVLFFCGVPRYLKCISFERRKSGVWEYVPPEADRDKENPVLFGAVINAKQKLDDAMVGVHNTSHLVAIIEEKNQKK